MNIYKKKPLEVYAIKLINENFKNLIEIALIDLQNIQVGNDEVGFYVLISSLEGSMKARYGDWIVRGVNGEYYPIKNEIFLNTYDAC